MKTRAGRVTAVGVVVWLALAAGAVTAGPPAWSQPGTRAATVALRQSIPAAAFVPGKGLGMDYDNEGWQLTDKGSSTATFYTAVRLPQGATVTKFTLHFYDTSAVVGAAAQLFSCLWSQSGTTLEMARAAPASADAPGYGSVADTTVAEPVIDNATHSYWVACALPPVTEVKLKGVVIDYTPPSATDAFFSLSAAAFAPQEDGYDYTLDGERLTHNHSPSGGMATGFYYAPVRLPQGATVTRMTFYFYDNSAAGSAVATLKRSRFGQVGVEEMAVASSPTSGAPGASSSVDDNISLATIDNYAYSYLLAWDLPADQSVQARGVVIEYQAPAGAAEAYSSPSAPLKPRKDDYDYVNRGNSLVHNAGPEGQYVAAVRLPDGAEVKGATFFWYDASNTQRCKAWLQRSVLGSDNWMSMASADSGQGNTQGFGSLLDNTVANRFINNGSYGYYALFELPPGADVWACGMMVDLALHAYLPVMARNRAW